MGRACEREQDLNGAAQSYTRALELSPKYGDAYVALGRVYGEQGDTGSVSRMARQLRAANVNSRRTI